ncbi:MAG: hypothetical protein FWE11_04325 [Defluviitaleaceae bacterium]|nr:hypothetical protein [Defluviitaleaceae bacterium]
MMNYIPEPIVYNEAEAEKSRLLSLYNIIDWIDFGLIFAIIAYSAVSFQELGEGLELFESGWLVYLLDFPPSVIGLLLCLASLVVSVSAIATAIMIQRKGANKSKLRLFSRFIVWGVWIPVDIYLIFITIAGLVR